MDIFILALTCLINIALGLFVLFQNRGAWVNSTFGLLATSISVWVLSNYLTNYPLNGDIAAADIANRIAYLSALAVIFLAALFTYFYPVIRHTSKSEKIFLCSASIVVALLSVTTFVSGEVTYDTNGEIVYSIGQLLWVYVFYFLAAVGIVIRNLVFTKALLDKQKKRQARFVMLAISITAVLGLFMNVIIPVIADEWHTTRFGPLSTVLLVGAISYLIARHGLFDVKFAAVRTVAYVGSLATLSLVYWVLAYIFSVVVLRSQISDTVSASPANILIAIILAFLFQPTKALFDRWTDAIFYRDSYKTDEFFVRMSSILSSTTDLRGLLDHASAEIARTLKASQVFFLIYYKSDKIHHVSAGTPGHAHIPIHDTVMIDQLAAESQQRIIQIEMLEEYLPVFSLLHTHKIELVMPLRQEGKINGYVFLGEHLGSNYSNKDLSVLETIANELSIAIQNALSLQEVKDLNATLQQRINLATKELRSSNAQLVHVDEVKDEFISMASHQLRTPLTSIKGYLSMVLEGDVGEVAPKQRAMLQESFKSSERMVRLITDFLNVSRLQTGKFTIEKSLFDLDEITKQEVHNLSIIAKQRGQNLRFVSKGDPVAVMADESKIRQVIMNYIDNAIYYSKPHSTIVIKLTVDRGFAALTVVDSGIGVPYSEQRNLFNKFFRADNARKQRPDGTGIGLYLARRVIEAHGGSIIFSSKEGHGSTFGFKLHIDKEHSSDDVKKLDEAEALVNSV